MLIGERFQELYPQLSVTLFLHRFHWKHPQFVAYPARIPFRGLGREMGSCEHGERKYTEE